MMNLSNIWTNWTIYQRLNFPMDCLDYLNFSRFIPRTVRIHGHGWRNQPRIKYIYFTVSTITQPIYSHSFHLTPVFMTPSNPQPLCSPDVFRLSTPWSRMSTESYSGVTLPSVPPIHNKWLLHGLYIIQISNINFIGVIRVLFYLKIWDKSLGRR